MRSQDGTATQERVQEWLRTSPMRITRARASVATVLLRQEYPISAEVVFRQLIEDGEDVSLGTVYRILKQMEDEGLVLRDRQVSSNGLKAVYTIRSAVAATRAYLFRCDVCDRQQRVSDSVLASQLANVAATEGFQLPAVVEIPARCRECSPA